MVVAGVSERCYVGLLLDLFHNDTINIPKILLHSATSTRLTVEIMATGTDTILDMKIRDDDVDHLVSYMTDCETMPLTLDRANENETSNSLLRDDSKQKKELVEVWRKEMGNGATYRAFIAAAEKEGMKDLAHRVKAILLERERGKS